MAEPTDAPHPDDASSAQADDKVVGIDKARARKTSAATADPPPPPPENRDTRTTGTGGGPGGGDKKAGKRGEKKIDWGRYTYMIENFVLVYPTDTAWDRAKRKLVKISNMAHMYGSDYVRMWKASPDRESIDEEQLVFDPTGECGDGAINLWDGLAVEPVPCADKDVEPMLQLLRHLCGRCDDSVSSVDEIMHWVLCWLALPFQRRGAKMATALVFHGPQGVGKNLFFDVIRDMYGKYGVMVGQTEIEEKYNGWISAKQLVVCNEVVSRQELYHNKNRLKWMIDSPRIPIRTMQTDTRWEDNWANLVFLSNERRPLLLELGDRRHLVVYTPTPEDKGLYDRVRAFLDDDGAAKFLHYLMQYPVDDFHPHTKPLATEAKNELIELSLSPDERFMGEWIEGYLHLPMQVCSAEQLYRAFRRWCDNAGEKYPPPQVAFTTNAKRWALERVERDELGQRKEPCLAYKVINLDRQAAGSGRKAVRCWLPRGTGPLNGVSEGAWAAESIDAFELALSRFLRTREGNEDTPPPPKGEKKGGREDESVTA